MFVTKLGHFAGIIAPIFFALLAASAPRGSRTLYPVTISNVSKELVGAVVHDASHQNVSQSRLPIWYDETQATSDSKAVFAHFMVCKSIQTDKYGSASSS